MSLLHTTLTRLCETKERVQVRTRNKFGQITKYTGYIERVKDDVFQVCHNSKTYYGNTVFLKFETIEEIRATKGKRRKTGMYYEVFYEENTFAMSTDGFLDMTATLRQLLTC
jgi:hypothetical protein